MTVRQLLESMDSREISEWIAFFNMKPAKREEKTLPLEDQIRKTLQGRKTNK